MAPTFYNVLEPIPSPWRLFKVVTTLLAASTTLDKPAVPGFEMKLGLTNHSLLGGAPNEDLQKAFKLDMTPSTRSYSYYDTDGEDSDGHELQGEKWTVRLRHKEDSDFELVYKKRFAVEPDTDEESGLDAALQIAHDAGFDKSDDNYDSEVDWLYSKRVLSFQIKKKLSAKKYKGTKLPSSKTGLKWLIENAPGKLEDWGDKNWGIETLKKARAHGPVTSNVYTGTWADEEVKIEVLPIKGLDGDTVTLVELSFSADDEESATTLRSKALAQLKASGWLLDRDMLKTPLVLDRY